MLCHLHTNRPPPCSRTLSPKYKNSKLDTTQLAENAALGFIKNTYISNYARYIYMPRTCTMPTSWRFDRHKNRIYGQLFMCSSNNNSNGTEISEKRQKRLMPYTRIHAHQSTEKRQWYNSWCFVQNLHKNPKATERKKNHIISSQCSSCDIRYTMRCTRGSGSGSPIIFMHIGRQLEY